MKDNGKNNRMITKNFFGSIEITLGSNTMYALDFSVARSIVIAVEMILAFRSPRMIVYINIADVGVEIL